ncbi:MAG: DUF2490 domain-containing protein [Verrucomicrobiota bacterium]
MALALVLSFAPAVVDANTVQDGRLWLAAIGQGPLAHEDSRLAKWRWWLEGQVRFRDHMGTFVQGFPRIGLGREILPNTTLWLGYAFVRTEPASGASSNENRIFQQLLWSRAFDGVGVIARTRLEQRFFDTGDDLGWRIRQWVKVTLPLVSRLSLALHDEIFLNLNDTDWGARSGLDQNRFFVGPGWNFDQRGRFRGEIGYLNQFVQGARADQVNHVLSLTLLVTY